MSNYKKIEGGLHICRAYLTPSKEVQLILRDDENEALIMINAPSIKIIDRDKYPTLLCPPCDENCMSVPSFLEMFRNPTKKIQEVTESKHGTNNKNEIGGKHESGSSVVTDSDSPCRPSTQKTVDSSGRIVIQNESDRGYRIKETNKTSIGGDDSIDKDNVDSVTNQNHKESHQEPMEYLVGKITVRKDLFIEEQEGAQEEQIQEHFKQEQDVPRPIRPFQPEDSVYEVPVDDNAFDLCTLYQCQFCSNTSFSCFKKFHRHLLSHRELSWIMCSFCEEPSEVFQDILSYRNHIKVKHKLLFLCKPCHIPFKNVYAFWVHQKYIHHKSSLRSAFGKPPGWVKDDALYPWEGIESTKSLCPYCGKRILGPSRFRYHIWTHFS